jgi:hypothetical protein
MLKIITLMFMLIGMIACGNNQTEKKKAFELENQFQFDAAKISFDSNVPAGIGTLLSKIKEDEKSATYEFCNWVLIDKNKALTSSSCVPNSLKASKDKDCGNYLFGKFKTNSDAAEAKCKKVLFASEVSENDFFTNDYALIELDRDITDSDFHPLNRKGITDGEEVTVMALSHSSEPGIFLNFSSSYTPTKCRIISSDIFGKILSTGSSPVFGFKLNPHYFDDNCQPPIGKSGAAVITKDGSLIGLSNSVRDFKTMIPPELRSSKEFVKDMTLITNFSCQKFNLESLDSDISSACAKENLSDRIKIKNERVVIDDQINNDLAKIMTNLPYIFKYNYEVQKQDNRFSVSIAPFCILPLTLWRASDLIKISKYSEIKTSYQLSYSASYKMFVSDYGNYSVISESIQNDRAYRTIQNLDKMETNNEVQLEIYEPGVLTSYINYERMKVCVE